MSDKHCVKCPEKALYAGVDVKKAVYCRKCFINMVIHKFRSSISKKRIFKIRESMEQSEYKKLMINPTILVLVSAVEEEEIELVEKKVKALKESILPNVPWYVVHLGSALGNQSFEIIDKCQGLQQIPALQSLLNSCCTSTSKSELLRLLREKTCTQVAKSLSISKILLPEDGDYLGRLALAQLCLGRGPAISELTAVVDKRPNGIWFVRPLRDISKKEVALVNYLNRYEKDVIRVKKLDLIFPGSIHSATTTFVDTLLSEGFKSTITTVLSTAGKLHLLPQDQICGLCYLSGAVPSAAVPSSLQLCPICQSCLDLTKEISNCSLLNPLLLL